MRLILPALLCMFLLIILIPIAFGLLKTMQIQNDPRQKEFLGGTVPGNLPNGPYTGTDLQGAAWLGKRFSAKTATGINVFTTSEKYPFKMSTGFGITDKNLKVIKIDYSQNKNPWWLKFLQDEIVETSPGKFLGKIQVNVIPGLPFSLGYFELKK